MREFTEGAQSGWPPSGRSEDAGTSSQVATEEVEDQLRALDSVVRSARTRHLVALAGKPHELHLASQEAERDEQLFSLFDRTPKVAVGVLLVIVVGAFIVGRRKGRRQTTIVEIRRV